MNQTENEKEPKTRISLNSTEISLVLEALGTYRGVELEHKRYINEARAEILVGRLQNGYNRKSKYNDKLLVEAQKKQDAI